MELGLTNFQSNSYGILLERYYRIYADYSFSLPYSFLKYYKPIYIYIYTSIFGYKHIIYTYILCHCTVEIPFTNYGYVCYTVLFHEYVFTGTIRLQI